MIRTGSDFSGAGAFDVAMERIGVLQEKQFACDMDKFARRSYLANFGTKKDLELLDHKDVKFIDSVYYRLYNSKKKPSDEDVQKASSLARIYAHKFSFYYPWDVYQREIPAEPLDKYMTSPPCQAFSLAGKRKGKDDLRGILFFNSLEFIAKNKPKTFIFENVKGLLSDNKGVTFSEWINILGGCSVNGVPVVFPYEDAVPYHIFYKVLNAKKHGVPQNRERVFIIGIRDGLNYSSFQWPQEIPLTRKLKDVLENEVDEKYFLTESALKGLIKDSMNQEKKGFGFIFKPKNHNEISNTISTKESQRKTGTYIKIGTWRTHKDGQGFRETEDGNCPTIPARAREDGSGQPVIKVCIPVLTPDRPEKLQNGRRFKDDGEEMFTIITQDRHGVYDGYRIRRLTPIECFRLMDFPDSHVQNSREKAQMSDSQLYKQAGNSIVTQHLVDIGKKLIEIIS